MQIDAQVVIRFDSEDAPLGALKTNGKINALLARTYSEGHVRTPALAAIPITSFVEILHSRAMANLSHARDDQMQESTHLGSLVGKILRAHCLHGAPSTTETGLMQQSIPQKLLLDHQCSQYPRCSMHRAPMYDWAGLNHSA